MSRPIGHGPVVELKVGRALPAALVAIALAFGLAWRFVPIGLDVLLTVFVLIVGLLVGSTLIARLDECVGWTRSAFATIGRRTLLPSAPRAKDLVEFESMFASTMRYEHDLYLKMRPHMRYVAQVRLAARGIELDHDPRARELLGDLYDLVRTKNAVPRGALFGAGVPIVSLTTMVKRLEEL